MAALSESEPNLDRRAAYLAVFFVLLLVGGVVLIADGVDAQRPPPQKPVVSPGGLSPVSPLHNETIYNNTPLVVVMMNASAGYKLDTVVFTFDGRQVQFLEDDFRIDAEEMSYQVSTLFKLGPGQHNVTVQIEAEDGTIHRLDLSFYYSNTPPTESNAAAIFKTVLVVFATFVGLGIMGVLSWVVYLMKVKGWTWRKFTVRFNVPREVFTLYVPVTLAVVAGLTGLFLRSEVVAFATAFASILPPGVAERLAPAERLATEYIVLAVVVLAAVPYAVDVQAQRIRKRAYERAYAQFLFEMADAMRGGIDPMKAVLELAKTETGLLKEPLKVAADGIRLGRPFDTVLENMAKPMDSSLISRYAMLVGQAAKVGGEISNVVYRAAKDMDDMVKIEGEKSRAMKTPIMTIYIAFGVLLMMVNTLMDFGPQLADLDISALTSGNLASGGDGTPLTERLTVAEMERRFFHLLMITSIGTGLLIGSFTDGKLRYGLVHMVVMILIGSVFYPLFVL